MEKAATHVAIVDDELSVRNALARLLSAASFQTKSYSSAREFINSLKLGSPHCLIVDVHMPDFSGLDLQKYLSRNRQSIPVVVITAFDDPDVRARCLSLGAVAYLTKPLHSGVLVDAVTKATKDHADL
jgi:FixJ family two-component response regulator